MPPILNTYPAIGHLEHCRRLSTGGGGGGGGGLKERRRIKWSLRDCGGGSLRPAGAFVLTDRNIPPINLRKIGKVKLLISQR